MQDQPPALTDVAPHIAEIRLRRPNSANRLLPADLQALLGMIDELNRRSDIHVVLLAADGDVFSAGFDLGSLTGGKNTTRELDANGESPFERVANALAAVRAVTIAVIQGAVVGGSTDLALACDLRIGGERASLLMPAARIGLPLYASAIERYVSRLGVDVAKRLIFLGERVKAHEMKAIGFLAELVADDQLTDRSRALAEQIASLAPKPLAAMKRALNSAASQGVVAAEVRADLRGAFDRDLIRSRLASARAERSR